MRILSVLTLACMLLLGVCGAAHAMGSFGESVCDDLQGPFRSSCTLERGSSSNICIVKCPGRLLSSRNNSPDMFWNTVTKHRRTSPDGEVHAFCHSKSKRSSVGYSFTCSDALKNDNGILMPVN